MVMESKSKSNLLQYYREHFDGSLIEKRSTYLSATDQLAAIQLAILFLQKKSGTNNEVTNDKLIDIQQKINERKDNNIPTPSKCSQNTVSNESADENGFHFDKVCQSYISLKKKCNLIDENDIRSYYMNKEEECESIKTADIFTPDALSKFSGSSNSECGDQLDDEASILVENIFTSYLKLLVNTKNEIALARVINVPIRGISHKAFTDIRKTADQKSMSMYQIISSFTRQITLGGKGYVPDESHVLYKVKDGVTEFMDLMDKLQTVIDTSTNFRSDVIAMVKAIKISLVRVQDPVFTPKVINRVMEKLQENVESFKPSKSEESILVLRDYLDSLSCSESNLTSAILCSMLKTPIVDSTAIQKILPSLKTKFTTPIITDETPKKIKVVKDREKPVSTKDQSDYGGFLLDRTPTTRKPHQATVMSPLCSPIPEIRLIRCHTVSGSSSTKPLSLFANSKSSKSSNPVKSSKKRLVAETKENKAPDVNKKRYKKETKDMVSKKERPQPNKKKGKNIKLLTGQKKLSDFFQLPGK